MKTKCLFIFLLLFHIAGTTQQLQWLNVFKGAGASLGTNHISTDMAGNVYVAGAFAGTFDADPGPGINMIIANGFNDGFVAKFDSSGQLQFIHILSTSGIDFYTCVRCAPNNTVFVVGSDNNGIVLDKLSPTGSLLAHVQIGMSGDEADAFCFDNSMNLLVTGKFSGTRDFDPGSGVTNVTSNGSSDIFFCKYSSSLGLIWAKNVGSTSFELIPEIRLDSGNYILLAGCFSGTSATNDFDPSSSTYQLPRHGGYDIFICKYDLSGNFLSGISLGGSSNDYVYDIESDAQGNIYTVGKMGFSIDFNPDTTGPRLINSPSDGFVAIYDSSLHYKHAFAMRDTAGSSYCLSLALEQNGRFAIAMQFDASVDIDPDSLVANWLNSNSTQFWDIAICEFDTSCHLLQAMQLGRWNSSDIPDVIELTDNGFYLSGHFNNLCDFNPGYYPEVKTAEGVFDIFIGKYIFKYNTIGGHIFLDVNADTIHQTTEPFLSNYWSVISPDNILRNSDNSGFFRFATDTGLKTVTAFDPIHWSSFPVQYQTGFSSYWNTDTSLIFAVHATDFFPDIETIITPYTNTVRPGFSSAYRVAVINNGTSSYSSFSLKLVKDSVLSYISSNPPADSIVADTVYWNNLSLGLFQHIYLDAFFQASTNAPINGITTLISIPTASISDSMPQNTTDTLVMPVRGSYDPNIKISNPVDTFSISTNNLYYTIHFQNTGTDTAFTVIIRDTLSQFLDPSSIQLLISSHPVDLTAFSDGKLAFVFYDILLPDSGTNELRSHGFVTFRVNIRNNFTPLDTIKNRSYIYFDYNDPVQTNETKNYIYNPTGILSHIENDHGIILFPNPCTSFINIALKKQENVTIEVYSAMGDKVYEITSSNRQDFQLDMSSYSNGLYFLRFIFDDWQTTKKIILDNLER